jgi:CNT family concentrative nucleoside transporter
MILATLLCIIALVGLIDGLLTWFGCYLNLSGEYDLTLELILGYLFYPLAFLLGVPRQNGDLLKVARLIGIKVIEVSKVLTLKSIKLTGFDVRTNLLPTRSCRRTLYTLL